MTPPRLGGRVPGLVPDCEVIVGEAGEDRHGAQHHQRRPGGRQRGQGDREGALGAGACHGGPEEGVKQRVGGDIDHQELPGSGEGALDRPGQED